MNECNMSNMSKRGEYQYHFKGCKNASSEKRGPKDTLF